MGAFSRCPGFTFYHRCTFWRLRCWGNRSWRIHCSHWYKYLSSHVRFKQVPISSITGSVKNAIIPGLYAYEAGQPAVGDLFEYSKNQAPKHIVDKANEHHMPVLNYLEELASHIKIEEQHVVVLDWLNGNRSILSNSHLTGSIFGLTLQTPYEMIHRAYIEATAFGTKLIMKQFEDNHIPVHTVYASGGIPQKSKLLVEIYANVLNKRLSS